MMSTEFRDALSKWSGLKVLVTGVSGFIGSCLCNFLTRTEAEVHTISRTAQSVENSRLRCWYGDLESIETTRAVLSAAKPDVIFHLAGRATGYRELPLVLPTFYNNLVTTVNLLTVAAEVGCLRIVLPGSSEEPESSCANAIASSPYAASKAAASLYARMFHSLYGIPVVVGRIFLTYGPGPENPNKLIPYVIRSLLEGASPRLTSGKRQVDWIYVDDVVRGLLAAALVPDIEGSTIDLGSGTLISIRELVEKIAQLIGAEVNPLFGALPDRPEAPFRSANIDDAREKLHWEPMISLEEGLRRTIDWHRGHL
jgi:nucleoside-diphosphate-sugar epimerase